MKLPSVYDIEALAGKRVLVRASLNVPLVEGEVRNAFRIKRALLTMRFLQKQGAKVVVIAHIGRQESESLRPVYEALKEHIELSFVPDIAGEEVSTALAAMKNSDIILLENVRQMEGETKNDAAFAKQLADYGEVYVNDAFAASHREHASIVGVAQLLPTYFGINFLHECEELNKALSPEGRSAFILGGAKFETKIPLIEKFISLYDSVCVGGALANDFYKARGLEVGKSLVSDVDLKKSGLLKAKNIFLPEDVVVQNVAGEIRTCLPSEVQADEIIFDAGPDTISAWAKLVEKADTVLWNGPLGDYEKGFEEGTEALAEVISKAKGYSIIGGGDTIAAVEAADVGETFGFMSTGGGAMLTYLETGTLPAIEVVMKR